MTSTGKLTRRAALLGIGATTIGIAAAGCGTGGPSDTSTSTPTDLADVPVKQLGADATDAPFYPDGYVGPRARTYPTFADGSKTFRVVVPQESTIVGDWTTNHFSQWLEKQTGLKIEFQAVLITGADGSIDLTKINAMIASGDLPDAFLGIPFSAAQISLYGQQGLFTPLDALIETYAPELRQIFADKPALRNELKALDGKTYQMNAFSECYHCKVSPGRAWVNQDHLATVGATMPTTTDELRELLKLFKAKDPSGTGKMVPLAAGKGNALETYFMNSFLETPPEGWLTIQGGKVTFVGDKPEWRDGLRYLRNLYDDGTLAESTFTATAEELQVAGNQGRIGIARAYYQGQFIALDDKPSSPWTRYVALPPVKGPGGVQKAAWSDNLLTGTPLLITKTCTNPELLVQWGDRMFELTAQNNGGSGDKGPDGNWDWAAKGETGLTGKQAIAYSKAYPPPVGQSWNQYFLYYMSKDYREGARFDAKKANFEQNLIEATKQYEPYKPARENQMPKLIFDETAAAEEATLTAAIRPFVTQAIAEFSTGKKDVNDNAAWQGYVDTLAKMGLAKQIELYQRAYDALPK